jgi:nucleoside 2-deoxyribosyltransferase
MQLHDLPKDWVYYFASPYTSDCAYIRELRYLDVIKVATDLIRQDFTLIEPIAMSHQHAQRFGLPGTYAFWQKRDRKFIDLCDAVMVCLLDGWDQSVGMADEIEYAKSQNKPVYYLNPSELRLVSEEEAKNYAIH